MFIKASSLSEYECLISENEGLINDRKAMLKSVAARINDYRNRLNTAVGDYKEYCTEIIVKETDLYERIDIVIKNAENFQEHLIKSYQEMKNRLGM